MMFCPKCGAIMYPKEEGKKKFLACKCGYSNKKVKSEMKEKVDDREEIEVLDSEQSTNPKVEAECPDCGPTTAEFWTVQTRASDEAETQFYKCTQCKKTWKE